MTLRLLLVLTLCAWSAVPSRLADVTGRWRVTISTGDGSDRGRGVARAERGEGDGLDWAE